MSDLEHLNALLFHPPRVAEREGLRLDGRRHDRWVGRYDGGALAVEGRFVYGRRDGTWRRFRPDGALELEVSFDKGVRHGPIRAWWPDGTLALEGRYERGELAHARAWRRSGRAWRGVGSTPELVSAA